MGIFDGGPGLGGLARWVSTADGAIRRGRLAAVVLCGYVVFACTYLPINVFSIGRAAHRLWLPGEARIPLVPEFEYLYSLTYVLPLALVVWLPDVRRFRRAGLAFALTLGVAYATYLLFPVYLERPPLVVHSPATFLLALEYHDWITDHHHDELVRRFAAEGFAVATRDHAASKTGYVFAKKKC